MFISSYKYTRAHHADYSSYNMAISTRMYKLKYEIFHRTKVKDITFLPSLDNELNYFKQYHLNYFVFIKIQFHFYHYNYNTKVTHFKTYFTIMYYHEAINR